MGLLSKKASKSISNWQNQQIYNGRTNTQLIENCECLCRGTNQMEILGYGKINVLSFLRRMNVLFKLS